jgi:glycosyltransferase involved in cell wall biosynthesis
MMGSKVSVSIGMPVYNEERYLEQALQSLLSQSVENFELIISDNASTDRTGEICLTYAAKDPRVRYHRMEANLGSNANFNRVFQLSTAAYFFGPRVMTSGTKPS